MKHIVRIPGSLDLQQSWIVVSPVAGSKVYILTAGSVAVLERSLLDSRIQRQLLLELPDHAGTPGVVRPEHAAEVPHEGSELWRRQGDTLGGEVSEPQMIVKVETEPAEVAARVLHDLFAGQLGVLSEDRVREEELGEGARVLQPPHCRGHDVEVTNQPLLRLSEETIFIIVDCEVT